MAKQSPASAALSGTATLPPPFRHHHFAQQVPSSGRRPLTQTRRKGQGRGEEGTQNGRPMDYDGSQATPTGAADEFLPVILPKSRHWGAEHKYLAQVVARLGQERGFRAIHEEPVSGGRVDVALRRANFAIACEISVTTEVAHELGNARKCMAGGFQHVILIATDEGKRVRLQRACAETKQPEIRVCSPDEFAQFLDTLSVPEPSEKTGARLQGPSESAETICLMRWRSEERPSAKLLHNP